MTYVILSVVVLTIIIVATAPVLRRLPHRPLVLTAFALLALTVVFDNLIVASGIVAYDEAKISRVLMPIAPVEDLAYALGAVMIVPTLWQLLGSRRRRDEVEAAP